MRVQVFEVVQSQPRTDQGLVGVVVNGEAHYLPSEFELVVVKVFEDRPSAEAYVQISEPPSFEVAAGPEGGAKARVIAKPFTIRPSIRDDGTETHVRQSEKSEGNPYS
jgi:hypothetical protein